MTASRALPPAIIGIFLMSEFIGAKSTVGTAQEAFLAGFAASWSVLGASVGFLLFGLFFVRKLYNSGEYTISGAIAQKYGRSTMLTASERGLGARVSQYPRGQQMIIGGGASLC